MDYGEKITDSQVNYRPIGVPADPENEDLKNNRGKLSDVSRAWATGLLRRLPYFSLAAIALTLCLAGVMAVILKISEGEDIATWCRFGTPNHKVRLTVSVWISGLSLAMNKLAGIMFAEAVTVAWWTSAMEGRTIAQMHADWESGRSVLSAVLSMCRRRPFISRIVVASVACTLFSLNGIIFQKASAAVPLEHPHIHPVTAPLGQQLPPGWSGTGNTQTASVVQVITKSMSDITQAYNDKTPIRLAVSGCGNQSASTTSCTAILPGVGWNYECYSDTVPFNFPPDLKDVSEDQRASLKKQETVDWAGRVFDIHFDSNDEYGGSEIENKWNLNLTVIHKPSGDCSTSLIRRVCTMTPALVKYPISVISGVTTLRDPQSTVQWNASSHTKSGGPKTDTVVKVLSHPYGPKFDEKNYFTVNGIKLALQALLGSTNDVTAILLQPENSTTVENLEGDGSKSEGALSLIFAVPGSADVNQCGVTYRDPFQQVLNSIRDIAFRTAFAIAADDIGAVVAPDEDGGTISVNSVGGEALVGINKKTKYWKEVSDPSGHVMETVASYSTNWEYFLAGALLMVVCLSAISPALWGFWRLGRKISLSPLEIGKALHGPATERSVLDSGNDATNAQTEELVNLLGDVKVRYGEVAPGKLGFAPEDSVLGPVLGRVYS